MTPSDEEDNQNLLPWENEKRTDYHTDHTDQTDYTEFPQFPQWRLVAQGESTGRCPSTEHAKTESLHGFHHVDPARSDDSPRRRCQLEPCDWESARREQRPVGLDRCVIASDTGLICSQWYVFSSSNPSHISLKGKFHKTENSGVSTGGRLGTIYGHKNVFTAGCVWWILWALCSGYSTNLVSMCFMRGLCGVGGGLMIPNIVALLGITFPPGRKRNLGFALFGAMAPVGAAGGSLVSAVVIQLSEVQWLFFFLFVSNPCQ